MLKKLMNHKHLMKNKKSKGLTLIELLAVIIILGIIAAIAIPAVMNNIQESEAKSFREDINALQTAANQIRPITTVIDYTQIEEAGKLSETKIKAAAQKGTLKLQQGKTLNDAANSVKIEINGLTKADVKINGSAATGHDNLREQLADAFGVGTNTNVVLYAYPLDIELIYAGKYVNNELGYPKEIPTTGYGDKYQNKSFTSITGADVFPTADNKSGYFFLLDNGRVMYTGTDAMINDDQTVHFSSSYVK